LLRSLFRAGPESRCRLLDRFLYLVPSLFQTGLEILPCLGACLRQFMQFLLRSFQLRSQRLGFSANGGVELSKKLLDLPAEVVNLLIEVISIKSFVSHR
jgi:hypothetical protein